MSNEADIAWRFIAAQVAQPNVVDSIIELAARTRFYDLPGYMNRTWLFNPFEQVNGEPVVCDRNLPSIRIHHILRADDARHPHDHPWNARTIILRGWYIEERRCHGQATRVMQAGMTGAIKAGDYHRIARVSDGGVFTLFFTWKYIEEWGFNVGGSKVPWRTYLGIEE